MKNPIIISVLLLCLFAFRLPAQDNLSWKKHVKLADELYSKAQYADAGEHYLAAWKQKIKKKELAYKAGECFYIIRDYRNAAEAWKNVKDENVEHPLIGLRYARCLKQNGEYEAASSELVNFLAHYQGFDKATISQIVQNELRGCELAAQLAVKGDDPNIFIEHLSSNVNTPETEFAPFPFGDEALYFSSTMAKRAEIYRSLKSGNEWGKSTPIDNFPVIENDHFCNGTLTPDASRFYFTVCKSIESWGGLTTKCEIYVTRRAGKMWTAPERLPDYVNEPGISTTHPYVVHDGNTEILYFSSNRTGGTGGMDIWYTTREINSTANDFTLPINAGSRINTIGDEITPYYDQLDGILYFASNGQISIGGFDIFKVKGAKSFWEKPENMGTPINSPADDFFFIKTSSGKGGFLTSNRNFGMEKISTTHEDIFSFEYKKPTRQWVAQGEVYDKSTREVLPDVEVALYEYTPNGQRHFITKVVSENGKYDFAVEPSKKYYLEVAKDGFNLGSYEFDTYDFATYTDFGAPIYLEPYEQIGGSEEPMATKEKPEPPATANEKVTDPAPAEKTEVAKTEKTEEKPVAVSKESKSESKSVASEPSKQTGTYYKIQIIAIAKYDPNQSRYSKVKEMARLDSEYLSDRKLYRVLMGDYDTVEDAKAVLGKVQAIGEYKGAFIVEYKDGERVRTVAK